MILICHCPKCKGVYRELYAYGWSVCPFCGEKYLIGEEEPDLYAEVLAEDYGSGGNSEE